MQNRVSHSRETACSQLPSSVCKCAREACSVSAADCALHDSTHSGKQPILLAVCVCAAAFGVRAAVCALHDVAQPGKLLSAVHIQCVYVQQPLASVLQTVPRSTLREAACCQLLSCCVCMCRRNLYLPEDVLQTLEVFVMERKQLLAELTAAAEFQTATSTLTPGVPCCTA